MEWIMGDAFTGVVPRSGETKSSWKREFFMEYIYNCGVRYDPQSDNDFADL